MLKRLLKFFGLLLFACMFAMCMALGVVPIVPKRKETFETAIKLEEKENDPESDASTASFEKCR